MNHHLVYEFGFRVMLTFSQPEDQVPVFWPQTWKCGWIEWCDRNEGKTGRINEL